mgnify:CR=1 FL=1
MNRKKSLIILVMCIAILFMAIGYAAFSTTLKINGSVGISGKWNVHFTNITTGTIVGSASVNAVPTYTDTTATMDTNLQLPGDSITYTLTLKNDGNIDAIISAIDATADGSNAIIYTINGIKKGDKLAAGDTKTITIKIEYDSSFTSQPTDTSKLLTIDVTCVQDTGQTITSEDIDFKTTRLSGLILKNNTPKADTNINFDLINEAGLYYTSTNTQNNRPTYYFSGAVTNNYVSFAGLTWRIVRINEDGSIRLITQNTITTSKFNASSNDNAYVGYMYGTAASTTYDLTHANTNSSTVKTTVDSMFKTLISAANRNYLVDSGFCGDRSIADIFGTGIKNTGLGTDLTYYGFVSRSIGNKMPQFNCPNSNDLYTTSTGTTGNKALANLVGLITADEVIYAGGYTPSGSYYMDNGTDFWTMTPAAYDSGAKVYKANSGGGINSAVVTESLGIRFVVNLKGDIEVSSGTGTSSSPYVVKTS